MAQKVGITKDGSSVWIGSKVFENAFSKDFVRGGPSWFIANDFRESDSHLLLSDLKGIKADELFNGLQIKIDNPRRKTSEIDSVYFWNLDGKQMMGLLLTFKERDWRSRVSLKYFLDELVICAQASFSYCADIRVEVDEGFHDVWMDFDLVPDDECQKVFEAADRVLAELVINTLVRLESKFLSASPATDKDSQSEVKWWVQHVVVPLVGSGLGVALVTWLVF